MCLCVCVLVYLRGILGIIRLINVLAVSMYSLAYFTFPQLKASAVYNCFPIEWPILSETFTCKTVKYINISLGFDALVSLDYFTKSLLFIRIWRCLLRCVLCVVFIFVLYIVFCVVFIFVLCVYKTLPSVRAC